MTRYLLRQRIQIGGKLLKTECWIFIYRQAIRYCLWIDHFLYTLPHPAAPHFSDSCSQGGRGYRARRGQGKLLRKHWPRGLRIQGQGFTACPSQTGDTELKRAACFKGGIFSTLICSRMWTASEARPWCINSSILFKVPPCAWQLRVYLPMPPFQKHMPSL